MNITKGSDLYTLITWINNGTNTINRENLALRWAVNNGDISIVLYLRNIVDKKWKCHDCIVKPTCLNLCEGWNNGVEYDPM